jgi:hypothetical protein
MEYKIVICTCQKKPFDELKYYLKKTVEGTGGHSCLLST